MSVVVAVRDKDRIWMACDSQVTVGYTKATLVTEKKIWKPVDNHEIVMGLVGDLRDGNILSIQEDWIDELAQLKDEFGFKYMVEDVVPSMFEIMNRHGRLRVKENMKFMESQVMFAYKDKCFAIYDDGCVIEMQDMLAMGSGRVLSSGAFSAIRNKDISPRDKAIEAVKAACESDIYVNYPILVMNTKDNELLIIEK